MGIASALYGGAVMFSPKAAAYVAKYSFDKHWLPPRIAEHSVRYVDGACMFGAGVALIVIAFMR